MCQSIPEWPAEISEFILLEPRARKTAQQKFCTQSISKKRAVRMYGQIFFFEFFSSEICRNHLEKRAEKYAIKIANSALENILFALLKLLK